jgi:hypothetical protein
MGQTNKINLGSLTLMVAKSKGKAKVLSCRTRKVLITAWLVMIAVPVACSSDSSELTQSPPLETILPGETSAVNGATLLDTRCSVCHSANRPKKAKKTREQWEQTVTRMIGKGAKLSEAEKAVLVDYLAKAHGK